MSNIVNKLSKHLFWDVDVAALDQEVHAAHIISKVLQYGFYEDFLLLKAYYGIEKIADVAFKIKALDKKTASFIALLSNRSKENFVCYTTTPSTPKHWHF